MATSDRPRSGGTRAYVLHRYDWSETSLILELFTRDQGRVAVVAKGAKRPYSQLRSVLLPFQAVWAQLGRPSREASTEIQNLRSAEWHGPTAVLRGETLFSGFYLNELILKLLPRHDPHVCLFDAYAHTLDSLAQADALVAQAALRAFELVLLREVGLLPQLDAQANQQPLQLGQSYVLRPGLGLSLPQTEEVAPPAEAWLRLAEALAANDMARLQYACVPHLSPLKVMLRQLLHYHLGHQHLRTRDVMRDAQTFLDLGVQPTET